ncbi:MAG: TIGR02391 family protein [Cyanobacteria bacterium P01_H01_bin.153]
MNDSFDIYSFAAIQYMGTEGNPYTCFEALVRLINSGSKIKDAKLLAVPNGENAEHCFLLYVDGSLAAIKSGFASGYHGSGPIGLSAALHLLERHKIDVSEYLISAEIIERVEKSCLLVEDLEIINSQVAQPSYRLSGYMKYGDYSPCAGKIQQEFPLAIPFRIIDERIFGLAIGFKQDFDAVLMAGYRRLEDIVRERTGLTHDHGEKLFSKAFMREDSPLCWENLHPTEAKGRASLFSAIFMGYRNRRAHKENKDRKESALREFLLMNELYRLEAEAVERQSKEQ